MVEYEIKLPVIAIMRIMQILDEKCKDKANSRDYGIAADLYEKIEVTEQEREEKFTFKDKDGNLQVDVKAIRDAEPRKFILDFREIEKLDKILEEYPTLAPSERRLWFTYVRQQLENARKPALDDEKTKTERLASRRENSSKGVSAS